MKFRTFFGAAAFALAAGGCAAPAPSFQHPVGAAVELARAQQTLNPRAAQNTDPVAGIDGPAATHAVTEYEKSFKAPPPTFPVINIGGGGR